MNRLHEQLEESAAAVQARILLLTSPHEVSPLLLCAGEQCGGVQRSSRVWSAPEFGDFAEGKVLRAVWRLR